MNFYPKYTKFAFRDRTLQTEAFLSLGGRYGRWEIDFRTQVAVTKVRERFRYYDEYDGYVLYDKLVRYITIGLYPGVSFYSLLHTCVRLRHGLRIGVSALVDVSPDDDPGCDSDCWEGRFIPLPWAGLHPLDVSFRIWRHIWIEIAPVNFYFEMTQASFRSRRYFGWKYGFSMGLRFET